MPFFIVANPGQKGTAVARTNYQFQKRQKELARKQKKDEKRQRKLDKGAEKVEGEQPDEGQENQEDRP